MLGNDRKVVEGKQILFLFLNSIKTSLLFQYQGKEKFLNYLQSRSQDEVEI